MKKNPILPLLGALAMLVALFTFNGSAFAATTPNVTPSSFSAHLAELQKTCRVVSVHLNGAATEATCLQQKSSNTVQPYTFQSSCFPGAYNLAIYNNNYSGELCFLGRGYLPVAIYQVNEVYNAGSTSWYRYYRSGIGTFQTIPAGDDQVLQTSNSNIEITQIMDGCGAYPASC
jgi:hypothetical protein